MTFGLLRLASLPPACMLKFSRFRYLETFEEHNTYSSAIFLRHCMEKFPFTIECVQTDNGFEFTNRLNSHPTVKLTLFEKTCQQLGIRHKLIKPCTPRHNGKVERSHRKDNEELDRKSTRLNSSHPTTSRMPSSA